MKNKINTKSVFYIYFYINVLCKGIGLNSNSKIYFVLLLIGSFILFLKIINDKFSKKELFNAFILLGIGICTLFFSRSPTVLLTMITIIGLKGINIDTLIKGSLIIRIITFVLVIVLSSVGIIDNVQIDMYRSGGWSHRYGLGYGHPNITHLNYFIICAMYVYVRFKKIAIPELLVIGIVNKFLYNYTMCRTSYMVVYILIILVLFFRNKNNKILINISNIMLIGIFLFSVLTAITYEKINIINNLDRIFNGRISYSNYYISKYGISIFGNYLKNDTNAIFDNGYLLILVQFGLATTVVVGHMIWSLFNRSKKCENIKVILIGIPFLITFFTESYAPNIFMNLLLLIAGSELYKKDGKDVNS